MLNNFKKIRLVYNNEILEWKYLYQLEEFSKNSNDLYKENYFIKNLQAEKHLALDCLVDSHDKIFALSGVFNGGRYPQGVYRVLNRLWARKDLRTGQWSPFLTKSFLKDHLFEFNDIFRIVFVSIQGEKGKRFLNNYWKSKEAPKWGQGWKFYPKIVKVAPCNKKSCHQYVIFNQRDKGDLVWPTCGITKQEYDKLLD